jgi:hypothetical protein
MKKNFSLRLAGAMSTTAFIAFFLIFNVSGNKQHSRSSLTSLNVAALHASATVYVCDATNQNVCTITTPEGTGTGTGNGIIYQGD